MDRRIISTLAALVCLALVSGALGCAEKASSTATATAAGYGVKTVEVRASSFAFEPSTIMARQGDTLRLRVTNMSTSGHNITVQDPDGNILTSQDIPDGGTIETQIVLPRSGSYEYYCNKPFHSTLGMKGHIEAK
jgi:plastocyanin